MMNGWGIFTSGTRKVAMLQMYTAFLNRQTGEKVSMKRRSEKITMVEKRKCEHCEKDAIGYQGFACCSEYVCLDHADPFVLALKPGEKLASGECYFERFSITD